jgi:hypothetical protein
LVDFVVLLYWQIYFKRKKTGGISFNSTAPLTHVDEKLCYQILHEYKIHNAEVLSLKFTSMIYGCAFAPLMLMATRKKN